MKKIVFFLRHNNDLDHIAPILHKWILTKNIATDIIITSDKFLLNDYRIRYLKEISKGRQDINFYYITDFFGSYQKWLYKLYQIYSQYPNFEKHTTIKNSLDKVIESFMERYFINWSQGIVCFDWNSDYLTQQICVNAKSKFFITVALPHGDEPYYNTIQRETNINYKDAIHIYEQQSFFDYIIVPNNLCARRYKFMDKEQIKVLGSPRYCQEWLQIHNTIKPLTFLTAIPNKLKVVLFLRNKHFPINWEEVVTTIKLITQFKEIFLIVRNHTRGKLTFDINLTKPNLYVDDNTNSSVLIDWADLVLDIGTSVTWECSQNQKPVLMLDYLQANETTFGHYMKSTIVRSRDELLDNLRKFCKNKQRKIYNKHQRQKFIKEMLVDDGKVLERYCNFLEGVLNEI